MISSITNRGKVRFMLYRETMSSQVLIKFLSRLIKDSNCVSQTLILQLSSSMIKDSFLFHCNFSLWLLQLARIATSRMVFMNL
ncbi:MAG: hypothetical protein JXO50_11135 [Deltaproteobacteria bacterium]|nr:hypothetical protein [Candidatus Anaeroferrophillus wilburensis]